MTIKTKPERPMPADFAEVATRLGSGKAVMRHYRCGPTAVHRWSHEAGVMLDRGKSTHPHDLAESAKTMTVAQLMVHYGKTERRVRHWLSKMNVKAIPGTRRMDCPADFAALAPTMNKAQLMAHYAVSQYKTIDRWLDETGTTPARPHSSRPKTERPTGGNVRPSRGNGGSNVVRLRATSIYDDAADVLRRERWQVNRCDEKGLYAEKGKFWRVGTVICTSDELLVRADRARRRAA